MDRRTVLSFAGIVFPGAIAIVGCAKKKHAATNNPPATPRPRANQTPAARRSREHTAPSPSGETFPTTELGLASWYGYPYHGRMAANGEIYDMEKMTAAHRTLPFGTWVRVTSLVNNKSVEVRITDRGPFIDGRIVDLSHAAAQAIDLIGPGVFQVRLDVIAPPPAPVIVNLYAIQVGAFPDRDRAERMRGALGRQYGEARVLFHDGRPPTYRVLVGAESTVEGAILLSRRLQAEVGSGFIVRADDIPGSVPALSTR